MPTSFSSDDPLLYQRTDVYDTDTTETLAAGVRTMLDRLGEDPDREGLLKTPERVAKAYQFLTHGYRLDGEAILRKALFHEDYSEMILVKDIEVYSLCEHHMLPFFGKAHVAYIPKGKIVGLSKIPRLVDVYARRLQVQERLTVADSRLHPGSSRTRGRGRCHRSAAYVHDDARRREAELVDDDERDERRLPRQHPHAGGIHAPRPRLSAPRRRSPRTLPRPTASAPCLLPPIPNLRPTTDL